MVWLSRGPWPNAEAGGDGPASRTVEMKPCFWRSSAKERCSFVYGIDVRPSRAMEAF